MLSREHTTPPTHHPSIHHKPRSTQPQAIIQFTYPRAVRHYWPASVNSSPLVAHLSSNTCSPPDSRTGGGSHHRVCGTQEMTLNLADPRPLEPLDSTHSEYGPHARVSPTSVKAPPPGSDMFGIPASLRCTSREKADQGRKQMRVPRHPVSPVNFATIFGDVGDSPLHYHT